MRAFKAFTDQYYTLVLRTVNGFLHNEEDAKDLAQEVFIELYQSIHKFRKKASLSTWVYRIAVNKSLNFIRDNKRKRFWENIENVFSTGKEEKNAIVDPEKHAQSIESKENAEFLKKAIDSLPENQRIAFVLSKYDDLSNKKIAEVMDVSVSAVESLVHRAKQKLQKKLLNYFSPEAGR